MPIGIVKWFNDKKGYGFILPDGGSQEVFVHITAVRQAELDQLNGGQRIRYELEVGRQPGQVIAVNLKLL